MLRIITPEASKFLIVALISEASQEYGIGPGLLLWKGGGAWPTFFKHFLPTNWSSHHGPGNQSMCFASPEHTYPNYIFNYSGENNHRMGYQINWTYYEIDWGQNLLSNPYKLW